METRGLSKSIYPLYVHAWYGEDGKVKGLIPPTEHVGNEHVAMLDFMAAEVGCYPFEHWFEGVGNPQGGVSASPFGYIKWQNKTEEGDNGVVVEDVISLALDRLDYERVFHDSEQLKVAYEHLEDAISALEKEAAHQAALE